MATRPEPSEDSTGSANVPGVETVVGVQAAGVFAVDVILFVGQNAALEVVVAVGGGKGHAGLDDRTKETGERAADLFAGLNHEFVEGRRRLVCGAGLAGLR